MFLVMYLLDILLGSDLVRSRRRLACSQAPALSDYCHYVVLCLQLACSLHVLLQRLVVLSLSRSLIVHRRALDAISLAALLFVSMNVYCYRVEIVVGAVVIGLAWHMLFLVRFEGCMQRLKMKPCLHITFADLRFRDTRLRTLVCDAIEIRALWRRAVSVAG
jgi:hypothetical protein